MNNFEKEPKKKVYWHPVYAEPVCEDDLEKWSPADREKIFLVGEFTDDEWETFIKNQPKDDHGERIVSRP